MSILTEKRTQYERVQILLRNTDSEINTDFFFFF